MTPEYPLLHKAIKFALKAHAKQDRDGAAPLPYITHPIEVILNLRYVGHVTDQDILIAGALHDVLEETDISAPEIEKRFGPRVMHLVNELTREEPKDFQIVALSDEEIWHLRSEMLIEGIRRMSPDALQVKMADRLSNLSNAWVTRSGRKLERYLEQSVRILAVIPKETNIRLWDAIQAQLQRKPT